MLIKLIKKTKKIFIITMVLGGLSFSCSSHKSQDPVSYDDPKVMVTTWQIPSNDFELTLPLVNGYNYDFKVDWGDGSVQQEVVSYSDSAKSHTYARKGTYVVQISGQMQAWSFKKESLECEPLIKVNNLADMGWTDFSQMFYGCKNLIAVSGGDTSDVTNMGYMFYYAKNAEVDTSAWDTSNVTNMNNMFAYCDKANPDTSSWNVSNVVDMGRMFYWATAANPDTSSWDVSNVETMSMMFSSATNANPDTKNWNTGNVKNMGGMFSNALKAQPNTTSWDTSSVTRMTDMFNGAILATPNTSQWDTSNVSRMKTMFTYSDANPVMTLWSLESATDIEGMLSRSDISNKNYSDFLVMAKNTATQNGLSLGTVQAKYKPYAADARAYLVDTLNWIINDEGAE